MPTYGFDETVTEQEWSYALTPATGKGVVFFAGAWFPSAVTGRSQLKIDPGMGQAAGIVHNQLNPVLVDVPIPNTGGKWWMLVARYEWITNSVTFALKPSIDTGSSSGKVAPKDSVYLSAFPGVSWEQPIAWVWAQAASRNLEVYDLRLGIDGRPANSPIFIKYKRDSGNLIDAMLPDFKSSIISRTFANYPRGNVLISARATLASSSRPNGSAGNIRVLVNGENRSEDSNHYFGVEHSEWVWWDYFKHPGGDLKIEVLNGALNGLVHRNGTFLTVQWLSGDGIYD